MRMTPAVKVILIINIVFYVLTYWITPAFPLGGSSDWFLALNALHPVHTGGFVPYQYLTYMFMHGGWWHLFFNMWSLMIFGNAVEQQLGTKRFTWYYLLCGVGSALINQLCTALGIIPAALLLGASGAIYGVMAAAAFFFPNAKLFIIPFPFPIKLKWLVGFYTVAEMYMGITSVDGVAHFAHLGGILVGVAILLFWRAQERRRAQWGHSYWSSSTTTAGGHYDRDESLWDKLRKMVTPGPRTPKMRVTEVREENYQDHAYNERKRRENEEIDRILDKIRQDGYQNLTDTEKATLFNASERLREEHRQ